MKRYLRQIMLAIVLVIVMYWIDSDPPYESVWQRVAEFSILTAIMFTIIAGVDAIIKKLGQKG